MKSSIPMSFGTKTQADYSFSKQQNVPDYVCPLHWHDCFEILWVKNGSFGVSIADTEVILESGDIIVLPPCALHGSFSCVSEYEIQVFGYTDVLIYTPDLSFDNKKYLTPFRLNPTARIIRSDHPSSLGIRTCLANTMQASEETDSARELRIRAAILTLHASLYTALNGEHVYADSAGRYLLETERLIENRMAENISPYAIADALHISYSHFARLIRTNYGCSAGELITRMKISYAEQMMTSNVTLSITDIAEAIGYSSASYFARRFKQLRGCSPNEFRKLLISDGNTFTPQV